MGKVLIKCSITGQYYLALGKGVTANKAEAYHYDEDYARNWVGPDQIEPVEDKVLIRNVTFADGRGYFTGGNGLTVKAKAYHYDRAEAERITKHSPNVIKIEDIEPVQTDAEKIAWLEAKVAKFAADIVEKENKIVYLYENIEYLREESQTLTERVRKAEAKIVNLPFLLNTAVQETLRRVA